MYSGGLSSISYVGCVLVFLIQTTYCADICSSGTTRGTSLTFTRSRSHDYTKKICECYINNTGDMKMRLNLYFEKTKDSCSEYFVIKQNDSNVFERCSDAEIPIVVKDEVLVHRTMGIGFEIAYSWNETTESGQTGNLSLTVSSTEPKTNISVHCKPEWTTATSTKQTALDVTIEFGPVTFSSSASPEVGKPGASPTSNEPDVTTIRPKSRGRSGDPPIRPRSVAVTTQENSQVTEDSTTTGTDIQAGSSGEPKRSGVGIQTFLIVIVVLSFIIIAFIIGAFVFFCRRKTPTIETEAIGTPVIYAEPNKLNKLQRPRSVSDEPPYVTKSDVSVEIPVPQKSWEVKGQIPRHSIMVDNVVYDTEND